MKKYLIIKYEGATIDYHLCRDEQGETIRMDCMVDGAYKGKPEDLVGKTIICDPAPFLFIANDIEIIEGRE